jgi:branched-chain amino acid aminotransferase
VEAIYAPGGRILEGTTTNLFLVAGGAVKTPGKDVLEGITRSEVLEIADKRFPTTCRELFLNEAREADELFITATNKEVMPITKLDGRPVGDGRPGPITREIMRIFREKTRGN